MPNIAQALEKVHERIAAAAQAAGRDPDEIRLLAVSKTKPPEMIREAWDAGQRAFGENYVKEALSKMDALNDLVIEWHYIGRIQGNKTRDIARHFAWVHGLDKLKHAQQLSEYRGENRPPLNCCIQVNLSGEHSKGGIEADILPELALAVSRLPHLELRGLMTMPDPSSSREEQAAVFTRLAELFGQLRKQGLPLDTLSMGMSGDLELAIAAGSTMVRIGTDIFGPRN